MISTTAVIMRSRTRCFSFASIILSYQDSGVRAKFLDKGLLFLSQVALHRTAHGFAKVVIIAVLLRDHVHNRLDAISAGLRPQQGQQLDYRVWFTSNLRCGSDLVIHAS